MKSPRKNWTGRILLIIGLISIMELFCSVVIKAGLLRGINPAFCRVSYLLNYRYSYLLDLSNDVSTAYFMAYLFYLIALLPEKRKQKAIDKYIERYLRSIFSAMEELMLISDGFVEAAERDLAETPHVRSIRRENGESHFMTYREHFVQFYWQIQAQYQYISPYIVFAKNEVLDFLSELISCDYINQINDFLICSNTSQTDRTFEEKYDDKVMRQLHTRLKQML